MAEDKILAISAPCGEFTCASEPGKFCHNKGSIKYGQIGICRLFPSTDEAYTVLEEKDGWLLRCDACLIAERVNNANIIKAKHDALDAINLHKFKG